MPLAIAPQPAPAFENFIVGSNAAALAALRRRPLPLAPTYLWGAAGAGKTHLLHALAAELRLASGAAVGAFGPAVTEPWAWDERWQLVLIDDCDRLDAAQQHAAFALFVEAQGAGVPVVAAGRVPPVDLGVREDLRTRLGWGLVFHVEPVAEAEVRAALRREADRRGLFLPDELMSYVLVRHARDLGSLMGLLDRLDRYALERQRALTVPLLREMLATEAAEAQQPRAPTA
ncbi:regulatory inactivation of DnaA Hda protein [Rivibacter subsaxonicus]|uniref:Regulatory inactivation of DnaA Hda protein n=2 Tax=Rivibacter subsaxonicus TaxID=457575 RepID=A0A4Q7VH56_9BURK|nr:DnaA regulatory inactivator Hda [Rivibacter subsaxonicus]RZT95367.1 regulatory inactivation of DnaA Hda protein [Rivibacter subsaxonicus]